MGKKHEPSTARGVEPATPRWDTLVLVCKKCIRKRDGAADELRSELRRAMRTMEMPGRHRIRAVETGCLDVCPKDGVTIAVAGGRPGQVVVSPPPFDAAAAIIALFPPHEPG